MRKTLLSVAAVAALSTSAYAADSTAESGLVVNGEVRMFYIDRARDYSDAYGTDDFNERAFAIGGNLGVIKSDYGIEGLSTGVRFYTTQPVGNQLDASGENRVNATLFEGASADGYSILGEAYVNYATGKTNVKVGRQALNTPLAGGDDARMLPTLFEAAVLSNTDITDTTLIAAHVSKIAYGTFSNAYGKYDATKTLAQNASAMALTLTAGYGFSADREVGSFQDMGDAAIGQETSGVHALAAIYNNKDAGLKVQLWDYLATDILNAIYLQADYSMSLGDNKLIAAVQHINESDTGDKLAGKIASTYSAAKLGGTFGPVSAYAAMSQTGKDDSATLAGGIITPWGGMPAFTQGMVTRHQFFSDTSAMKVAATYSQDKVKATLAYMSFDVGETNGYIANHSWTATETMADVIYMMDKNLMLRYRLNMPDKFVEKADGETLSWTEHRFIVSYKF